MVLMGIRNEYLQIIIDFGKDLPETKLLIWICSYGWSSLEGEISLGKVHNRALYKPT